MMHTMAQLVRDYVIDLVYRSPDERTIEEKATSRAHRSPTLLKLAHDQCFGHDPVSVLEASCANHKPLFKPGTGLRLLPVAKQSAYGLKVAGIWGAHKNSAADKLYGCRVGLDDLEAIASP